MNDISSIHEYIQSLINSERLKYQVVYHRVLPERPASWADLEKPLPGELTDILSRIGVHRLYRHQSGAIDRVRSGRHVVVATPTASGKTLIYNLPLLEKVLTDIGSRALYIFPLKALAQDQLRTFETMASFCRTVTPSARIYDGDTSVWDRKRIRTAPPNVVMTNPEMLHLAILAYHRQWTAILLLKAALHRGLRTIVYTQSRKLTELIAIWAQNRSGAFAARISAYRAGFLPEERRAIESKLSSGELLAVISTSALELGIDIGDLDLCILVGYPGTVVATWQRGGRVGRSGQESALVLIAGEDALDQYFMRNPADFFDRFETDGLWFIVPSEIQRLAESRQMHFMGGIHAVEHAAIGIFPLLVMADRNDLGGISTPCHPQIEQAAVFIYDGVSGGAGLSRQAYERAESLKRLGYRLSLDHLARTTLNVKKSADGLMALQWWKEGKIREIVAYCKSDVVITRDLFKYGRRNDYLLFSNKAGHIVRVPVKW